MDYELLKTFICLANFKNFTKTAEQLHVVQSTITSRIKHLEDNVGKPLFIRTNKNVVLTTAGENFLPYAKQLDMVCKYMQINKHISVKITIEHSETLLQMLHDNELDIAFTYFNTKSPKFICEPFYSDKIILVTSPQNAINASGITDNQLKTLPLLSSAILTDQFQEWFHSIFPKNYAYPLDINISSGIITFLKEGIGFSFMLEHTVKKYLKEDSLVQVNLLESTPPNMDSYILVNKQRINSPAVSQWINYFKP